MSNSITFALSKGRILDETLPLLKAAGIELLEDPEASRKLIFPTSHPQVRIVIIRATDVPTFVEHGAADIGIAGKDKLMEHGAQGVYEPLDLKISPCRLMVAVPKGEEDNIAAKAAAGRLRVATSYTAIAKKYFESKGQQVKVVKLYGSMELAPLVGLADCIVDIVDTGNTLKANGLVATELMQTITSRLIVNKASMKTKHEILNPIIDQLAAAVG